MTDKESEKFKSIEIDLGEPKDRFEIAEALRLIAQKIESDYNSGIVGWSDVSWSVEREE